MPQICTPFTALLMQASLAVAVLTAAYIVQQKLSPFLRVDQLDDGSHAAVATRTRMRALVGCLCRKQTDSLQVDYNRLETWFLVTSVLILVAGMVFLSGGFIQGSLAYNVLTYLVTFLIGACK